MRRRWVPLCALSLWALHPPLARAYITAPVATLGRLCSSTYITFVRVEKLNTEKGVIIYRKIRDLKGKYPLETIRHAFDLKNTPQHQGPGDVPIRPDEKDWNYALHWAEVGKTAVIFSLKYDPYGDFGHTYIDRCWYATMCPKRDWDWWYSIYSDPQLLSRWHCGTPAQLVSALEQVLAGKTAVVPTLASGTRDDLRQGRGKIVGLKVSLEIWDYNPARDRAPSWVSKEIPALVKDLEDRDRQVRLRALRELAAAGPEAKAAVPELVSFIRDPDLDIRLGALGALGRIEPENPGIVPAGLELLKNPNPDRRLLAAEVLSQTPGRARAAGTALLALLQEPDPHHRLRVLEALSSARVGDAQAADAAAILLGEADPDVRLRSCVALALLGSSAKAAVPALIRTLRDTERDVRIQAADALGSIGREAASAVTALAAAVRSDPSGTVRMRSADALLKLGPDAKSSRPALEAALKDPAMAQRPEVLEKIREVQSRLK